MYMLLYCTYVFRHCSSVYSVLYVLRVLLWWDNCLKSSVFTCMYVLQGRQGSGGQKGGMIEAGWSSADIEYPLICVDVVHVCGVWW